MNPHLNKSITLIELLISIILLAVVVLGFSSIDLFSRYHVLTTDRQAQVQNDVSYALEHMSKEITKAIGNDYVYGADSVVKTGQAGAIAGDVAIRVYIDANANGLRETAAGTDHWVVYRYRPGSAPASERYQLWYCPECRNAPCTQCVPAWGSSRNILSRKITDFNANYNSGDNYVDIQVTARWDPAQSASNDNLQVSMKTRIKMPSVSTN